MKTSADTRPANRIVATSDCTLLVFRNAYDLPGACIICDNRNAGAWTQPMR